MYHLQLDGEDTESFSNTLTGLIFLSSYEKNDATDIETSMS